VQKIGVLAAKARRPTNQNTKVMEEITIIQNRWQQGRKLQGSANAITLADGSTLKGWYFLTECGTATASHNALKGFRPSDGFPTDGKGHSANDRDYQSDKDAQDITRTIARNYDSRAIQNPVIVSRDGVVLSGNGRTMAGEIAAHDNTDGAYIEYLQKYGSAYGFTPEQINAFAHPRLVFVLADDLPYTPTTFARFNARDMKSQSKTEQAVKFGKLIDDATFGRITATINAFETLGDFYASTEAATQCLKELLSCGVIDSMSYAEMIDGDSISATGKETLENVLIGKAFAADPDAARKATAYKSLRRAIVFALAEIANNLALANGYDLNTELSQAVNLAFVARSHGYKAGERVSAYARQMDAFTSETVCDVKDTITLALADAMNGDQVTLLKRILSVYNHQAQDAANGQTDIFAGGTVRTKSEILADVNAVFAKGTVNEQKQAERSAIEARTNDNVFVTLEQSTKIVKGGYAQFMTLSGDCITVQVEKIKGSLVTVMAKGGVRLTVSRSKLTPTADHLLCLPEWLAAGTVVTDGSRSKQRIAGVIDDMVFFEWINGGIFQAALSTVLLDWYPSKDNNCGLIEAA